MLYVCMYVVYVYVCTNTYYSAMYVHDIHNNKYGYYKYTLNILYMYLSNTNTSTQHSVY
jgi:hypothetical protein